MRRAGYYGSYNKTETRQRKNRQASREVLCGIKLARSEVEQSKRAG